MTSYHDSALIPAAVKTMVLTLLSFSVSVVLYQFGWNAHAALVAGLGTAGAALIALEFSHYLENYFLYGTHSRTLSEHHQDLLAAVDHEVEQFPLDSGKRKELVEKIVTVVEERSAS